MKRHIHILQAVKVAKQNIKCSAVGRSQLENRRRAQIGENAMNEELLAGSECDVENYRAECADKEVPL